jgi:putative tricarboxylic transport membrane protein
VGNIILLIMNLPMVPLFAYTLRLSYSILYPAIILICITGVYSVSSSIFDVWSMLLFGVAGYFMKKYDIPGAPMIIGLVLGPLMEHSLYRALALGQLNRFRDPVDFRGSLGILGDGDCRLFGDQDDANTNRRGES